MYYRIKRMHYRVVFSAQRTYVPLLSSGELPPRFQLWLMYDKNASAKSSSFWLGDGPYFHDSRRDELMIGSSIKWYIIRANRRLWIDGLRIPIRQQFWRCRIYSDIILLWHLLLANQRWCSDVVMTIWNRLGGGSSIAAFIVMYFSWWKLLGLIWIRCRDLLRTLIGRRHTQWPGAYQKNFGTNREGILVDIKESRVMNPKIMF